MGFGLLGFGLLGFGLLDCGLLGCECFAFEKLSGFCFVGFGFFDCDTVDFRVVIFAFAAGLADFADFGVLGLTGLVLDEVCVFSRFFKPGSLQTIICLFHDRTDHTHLCDYKF